jgi:hypothetical protein
VPAKKDDTGATKTVAETKKPAGLFSQFSTVEFMLLGFGLVVLVVLTGLLYLLLK